MMFVKNALTLSSLPPAQLELPTSASIKKSKLGFGQCVKTFHISTQEGSLAICITSPLKYAWFFRQKTHF